MITERTRTHDVMETPNDVAFLMMMSMLFRVCACAVQLVSIVIIRGLRVHARALQLTHAHAHAHARAHTRAHT